MPNNFYYSTYNQPINFFGYPDYDKWDYTNLPPNNVEKSEMARNVQIPRLESEENIGRENVIERANYRIQGEENLGNEIINYYPIENPNFANKAFEDIPQTGNNGYVNHYSHPNNHAIMMRNFLEFNNYAKQNDLNMRLNGNEFA